MNFNGSPMYHQMSYKVNTVRAFKAGLTPAILFASFLLLAGVTECVATDTKKFTEKFSTLF